MTPITWNIIGLDSNSPTSGPRLFPVGARICTDTSVSNVNVSFQWLSANPYVDLRAGSLSTINFASMAANTCSDAYFEVEIQTVPAAYETNRQYVITATDGTNTASSPTPRALYVEYLISQNRNATTNIRFGTNLGSLNSVPAGGTMSLLVGNTYTIELSASTATQGYEQLETFITLTNTIFRILSVSTTYSADTTPYLSSPNDKLYADACRWENDVNSPNYRSCLDSSKKAGGNIVTTYTVEILGGGGTTQTLNSLIYDFSGASFHYNSDYSVGARFAAIIDPTSVGIAKRFAPGTTSVGGISTLIFTLTNPNGDALSSFNFVDNLPTGMVIANPSMASTSSCGSAPSLTAAPSTNTIAFSNGTVAANGSCTISVNVTTAGTGTYDNTTNNLFVGDINTGKTASATLNVTNAPLPPACTTGIELARWTMAPAQGTSVPPVPSYVSPQVTTAVARFQPLPSLPGVQSISTTGNPANSWSGTGWGIDSITLTADTASYFEFELDTSEFKSNPLQPVRITFDVQPPSTGWAAPNNNVVHVYSSADSDAFSTILQKTDVVRGSWNVAVTAPAASTGDITRFRINAKGRSNGAPTAALLIDNIVITGCGVPLVPTLTKSFSPSTIATGGTSTLTFVLTNPNPTNLTGATFTDSFPTGMTLATPLVTSNTCGGAVTAGGDNNSFTFSSGTIPADSTCMVLVNVTTSANGPSTNISGFISTTQTGPNNTGTGSAAATLTIISPPQISKQFATSPILAGGVSRLDFTIVNPNLNQAISGVAFTDPLPGGMTVANLPNASTSGCGSPVFAPSAGGNNISFSGGSIAAGATCTVSVNVTVAGVGDYLNTSSSVTHLLNSQAVAGSTASDTLAVVPASPGITMLKQVGQSNALAGPWFTYLSVPEGGAVYYLLTIENTGDVPLTGINVNDPNVNTAACGWPGTLPVASASNDNHIATCIVGPVAAQPGVNLNTATASGTYNATPYTDVATATYATTGLTVVKEASPTSFTTDGETISYTFTVTNSGNAILSGPVIIDDDLTVDEACPALNTIGNNDNFFNPGEVLVCTASYVTTTDDVAAGRVTNIASANAGGTTSPTTTVTVFGPTPIIDAVDDDFSTTPIVGATGGTTATVFTNDTLNGTQFDPADVAVSMTDNGGLTGAIINPDGTITVPADIPTGTYTVTYQICEVLNPANCDTAEITIIVSAAAIEAVDDDFSTTPIVGATGGITATVFTNDTLNGAPIDPADVTVTITDNGGLTGATVNADGTVNVLAGTAAGTYTLTYQICEALNPANCDAAQVTIVISAAAIEAVTDDFSASPITGATGGTTASVFTNDTLNGTPFDPADVAVSITDNGGLTGTTVNADGTINVLAGTAAGTYTVTYQICEVLNSANCDTAEVTIVVSAAAIDAVDDDFSTTPIVGATGGITTTVFTNDTLNGTPFVSADVAVSITDNGGLTGVVINPDGTITVPADIPAGTYTVTYEICEVLNPANCDTAEVTIVVSAAAIDAVDDDFSATPIVGASGGTTAAVFTNDTLNGTPFDPADVAVSITDNGGLTGATVNADGTINVLAGTAAGTYTVTYQICEVLNPANCDTAEVIIVVSAAAIDAVDDDFSATPIAGATGGTTTTVFTNDTLNGVPFAPALVDVSLIGNGGLTGTTVNADGTINVPAGTVAGTYTITYQICEALNPANCDTAEVIIVVSSAIIDAVDDDFSAAPIAGTSGGTTATVFTNDTLSGVPFAPALVNVSITDNGGLMGATVNADGTISVPAGTAAGTYTLTYQICEALNPAICDTAEVIIVVSAATIDAVDNNFSPMPIAGATGGTTTTVFTNDTLNGAPFDPTDVTVSITGNGGLTGATINADGTISVPAGTAADTYTLTYQICEVLNPANCDTAEVIIVVSAAAIDAVDDDFSAAPIAGATDGTTATVFTNDTLNGAPFDPTGVTVSLTDNGGLTGATVNADGTINVPAGTAAGTYTVTYQICEALNPTNCDTAEVIIVVLAGTIDAVDDDFSATPIIGAAGGTTATVFTNDTLNGAPFAPALVNVSITDNGGLTGATVNANGTINVPAGTAAGTYTVTYQICEALKPANCDTAEAIIVVLAGTIDAVDDDFSAAPIVGATGGTTATAFTNDTINGAPFAPADVTVTITDNGGLTGATVNADGTINVPAGTAAGTYTVTYQICETLNPTNCDNAEVIIVVSAATIDAVDDDFSAAPIVGASGGTTVTVFANDTLNGAPFVPADVTVTITDDGGLTGVSINPDGTINVPAGTAAGTHTVTYQICETLNPTNCDTAEVIIVVLAGTIDAVDDDFSATPIIGAAGGTTATVFTNDTLNGAPFAPALVNVSITDNGGLTGATVNADGTINVPAGTAAATYTVTYQICEALNPTNCDTAEVIIVVSAATIDAVNDDFSATPITGAIGGTTATVFTNDTLNGVPFAPSQVNLSITDNGGLSGATVNADGTINVPAGTAAATYTVTYQICEALNLTNCDTAEVIIVVSAGTIDAVDDDFSTAPIVGATGGTTATVFTSDTLNGVPFAAADVTVTITDNGGLTGATVNADGTINVPAGTAAATYTVTYQICEALNPTNCDTAEAIIVVGEPDTANLSVDKVASTITAADPMQLSINDVVTYTITLNNAGPETATNVVLEDRLSPHTEFVSFGGGTMAADCNHNSGVITCNIGAIPAGTALTATYDARIVSLPASTADNFTNVVEVMASDQPDPNSTPGNTAPDEDDFARVDLPQIYDPPFGEKINDNGNPVLRWTMVWYNPTSVDAINVSVVDPILPGTTYIGPVSCQAFGTSTTTRCEYDAGTNSVVWEGTIAATTEGGSINDNRVEITFTVNVATGTLELNNIATLTVPSFGADPFTIQTNSRWTASGGPTPVPTVTATTPTPQSTAQPTVHPLTQLQDLGITELPTTGETPWWRAIILWLMGGTITMALLGILWRITGRK